MFIIYTFLWLLFTFAVGYGVLYFFKLNRKFNNDRLSSFLLSFLIGLLIDILLILFLILGYLIEIGVNELI